jgi:hypothetical protein
MKKEDKSLLISGFLIALSIALALNLSSCISPKRIAKICETCPTDDSDSIIRIETETIVYRAGALDSLMWVSTFDFSKFIDTIYKTDTLIQFKDNTWQISLLRGDNNKLELFATHQSDSIKELNRVIESSDNSKKIIEVPVEKIVPKYNRFFWFLLIWWLASLSLVAVWIWWQYQKGKVKWLSKFGL